ncbi:MAG: multidrug DMT transporter [Niastella sp. SCN 39-18]|nr:DNA cytosine methyltransferase [Sphingobacteriales bacterium]ODT55160.1 MAG: multidrug DMT transporter [Niastella sp. SCN 39-18]OJW09128.1 MAG: multidrug DMT transporter [Sphingobacteriales bacterium 39-19]
MPRKNSYITFTDQFCGAGGSSQGVRSLSKKKGGGIEVKMALNHWKLAIETHETNFPETLHDCTDISACDPRRYPSTDVMVTSPECTTHTPAGGNHHKALKAQMDLFASGKIDPATERSRATMWDVCRFAEYHKYNAIIVENVVEAKTRWPLFDNWLTCMHTLGYNHKCVYLNSMHCHPTPQSRDRMYVVFWKKGNKAPDLDFKPTAYCGKCCKDVQSVQTWKNPYKQYGKYRSQYVYSCPSCTTAVEPYYYAAMNIIDWSDRGQRIGDRKKPLASKSVDRIERGLKMFGDVPLQFHAAYSDQARGVVRPLTSYGFAQTTFSSQAIALPPVPYIIKMENLSNGDNNIRSAADVMQAQTCTHSSGIVFLTEYTSKGKARAITNVLNTATSREKMGILTDGALNAFLSYYNGGTDQASHLLASTGTQPTGQRLSLVSYTQPKIEDCYYRMLKDEEVKLSMAFDKDYIILGTSKNKVKQCGNAVTPPAMEWIAGQVIESFN